jgi:PAS domain S-box-containing protein
MGLLTSHAAWTAMRTGAPTTKWLTAALVMAVLAFTWVFARSIQNEYRAAVASGQMEANRTARHVSGHISRALDTGNLVTTHVKDIATFRGLAYFSTPAGHSRLAELAEDVPPVGSVWVMDAEANVVANSIEPAVGSANFSDRPYYAPLKSGEANIYISGLLYGRVSKLWFFSYNRAIRAPDGRFVGIAQASMHADDFQRFFENLGLPPGSRAALYRRDGVSVMRWPLDPAWQEVPVASAHHRPALSASDHGELPDSDDGMLTSYAGTRDHPLVVVVSIARSQVVAEFWKRLAWQGPLFAGALLIIGVLTVLGLRAQRAEARHLAERQAAERARRASEERFEHLANVVQHLVWAADDDGTVIYCNARAADYQDLARAADGSWHWKAALHPDDREATAHAWRSAVAARGMYVCEHRMQMRDGSYRWHLSRAQRKVHGGKAEWFGTATDIEDLKQAEQSLRDSERFMRHVLDNLFAFVGVLELDGTLIEANRVPLQAAGITAADVIGRKFWDCYWWNYDPNVQARLIAAYEEALTGKVVRYDVPVRVAGGRLLWIDFQLAPLRDGEERITHLIPSAMELSARRAAEDALREADRRKDEFVATLAHELRNPMAPLRTGLEILRLSADDPERRDYAIGVMRRQVSQLVRLLDDLLDLSRISTGKLRLQVEPVDMNQVVDAAVEACRAAITSAAQQLNVKVPPRPVVVRGDPVRLIQVLTNLLNNATKYTERSGRISVELFHRDGEAVVTVADTGLGIPPDQIERIFEMFVQIPAHRSAGRAGLGVGLHLVRRLVELHGGQVRAYSEGQGKGTVFEVKIPLAPLLSESVEASSAQGEGGRPLRVLVADDNRDAVETLSVLLRLQGHQVIVAYDGPTAYEAAKAAALDVALLDLGMPGMDGYELAQAIRSEPWGQNLPLVAVSGWGEKDDRLRTAAAGFDAHLTKPAAPDQLARVLAELCTQDGNAETSKRKEATDAEPAP